MKDILSLTAMSIIIDIINSLSLDKLVSIVSTIITLILAIILFCVKLKKALKDGKITPAEAKELKEGAEVIVLSAKQTTELLEAVKKETQQDEVSNTK